jgi:hypothetical protein
MIVISLHHLRRFRPYIIAELAGHDKVAYREAETHPAYEDKAEYPKQK